MAIQSRFRGFKKLTIEPKRKYVYLNFDGQIVKCEKDRFALDMSYNFVCKCKEPLRGKNITEQMICQRCNHPIG